MSEGVERTELYDNRDLGRLMGETAVPMSTIRRWAKGERIRVDARLSLERACRKLRLPTPEKKR